MGKVTIILTDWQGYKLQRKKHLGKNTITCGLKPLLDKIHTFSPGLDLDIRLVINQKEQSNEINLSKLQSIFLPTNKTYKQLKKNYPFISSVYFRKNENMDIGAYNFGIEMLRAEQYSGDVVFMNSSVVGPDSDNWLSDYRDLFYSAESIGICGITMNSHNTVSSERLFMPHIQSFFIYTNMKVLEDVFPEGFPLPDLDSNKVALIEKGEIGISTYVLAKGYSLVSSSFPRFVYSNGMKWTIPEGDIRFNSDYTCFANQISAITKSER